MLNGIASIYRLRMRPATICAAAFFSLASYNVFAAVTSCNAIVELPSEKRSGCTCGGALAKLPVSAPPGMKLVAACFPKYENGGWDGSFYFTGRYVELGTVTREDNEMVGDMLSYQAQKFSTYSPLASEATHLKFWDDPAAFKKFRAPRPTKKTPCWSAKVTIEVTALHLLGGGNDESGSYPLKYRVLRLGKYRSCN